MRCFIFLKYKTVEQKKKSDSIRKKLGIDLKRSLLLKRVKGTKFFLDLIPNKSIYTHKTKLMLVGNEVREFKIKDQIYTDLKKQKIIYKKYLFSTPYIIKNSLPNFHWKITGETKKIGNYTVIKAIGEEKIGKRKIRMPDISGKNNIKPELKSCLLKQEIIAWFSPEIPISNGPAHYGGLPGVILEPNCHRENICN